VLLRRRTLRPNDRSDSRGRPSCVLHASGANNVWHSRPVFFLLCGSHVAGGRDTFGPHVLSGPPEFCGGSPIQPLQQVRWHSCGGGHCAVSTIKLKSLRSHAQRQLFSASAATCTGTLFPPVRGDTVIAVACAPHSVAFEAGYPPSWANCTFSHELDVLPLVTVRPMFLFVKFVYICIVRVCVGPRRCPDRVTLDLCAAAQRLPMPLPMPPATSTCPVHAMGACARGAWRNALLICVSCKQAVCKRGV
jgi:hypothetical protein